MALTFSIQDKVFEVNSAGDDFINMNDHDANKFPVLSYIQTKYYRDPSLSFGQINQLKIELKTFFMEFNQSLDDRLVKEKKVYSKSTEMKMAILESIKRKDELYCFCIDFLDIIEFAIKNDSSLKALSD